MWYFVALCNFALTLIFKILHYTIILIVEFFGATLNSVSSQVPYSPLCDCSCTSPHWKQLFWIAWRLRPRLRGKKRNMVFNHSVEPLHQSVYKFFSVSSVNRLLLLAQFEMSFSITFPRKLSDTPMMDVILRKLQELVKDRKPGTLQSMGSHRVRHDWETELNWTDDFLILQNFSILVASTNTYLV